jgi:hypothetical protein
MPEQATKTQDKAQPTTADGREQARSALQVSMDRRG